MSKRYVNQIIRKLKCSKKKRSEIKKQLFSDVTSEIENGASEKEVLKRMGKPTEIAREFNESFSEEEKKKYKREKWLKIIGIIILVIGMVAGIIWWMLPKQMWIEDSNIFEKESVLEQAKIVVEFLEQDDYLALQQISDDTMASLLEGNDIITAKKQIGSDWGEKQSVGNVYVAEVTQMGIKNAVVQMHVTYEHESVMYTIFFNTDMELTGLWMQ